MALFECPPLYSSTGEDKLNGRRCGSGRTGEEHNGAIDVMANEVFFSVAGNRHLKIAPAN